MTAPHIKDLALGGAPDQGLANNQKRWLKVLLKRFSNLERLVMKLDRRADPSIIGTKWQVDELRKMKVVLENSQMKMVFSVPPCCCMCLTPVIFSKDPPNYRDVPLEEVDIDSEFQAWQGRRKIGMGDLEWTMHG